MRERVYSQAEWAKNERNWLLICLSHFVFSVLGFWYIADSWQSRVPAAYCRALDAAVVADSLCVRGDSIVAHIKEEAK
jgi:hypothetical protein